ncbi:hypothetical protein H1C71_032437, partial [Ictidomys tridecemlineatus]
CLQLGAAPPFCCLSRESSKKKKEREASEIPEWIDRCYVTGSCILHSTRGWEQGGDGQSSRRGHPCSLSSSQKQGAGHPSEKQQPDLFLVATFGFWAPHPGAGGCSTTLPPSFLPVDHRTASSTTDSSQMTGSCSAAQAGLKLTILLPQPPGSLGLRACSTLSYVEDRSGCRGQELQAQEAERNAQKGAPSWELSGGRGSQSCAGPVPGSLPDNPQCQGLLKGP